MIIKGEYRLKYLAVSHRWEDSVHPDCDDVQLQQLQAYLQEHPNIEYVFYDYLCLPQGGRAYRTPEENLEFYSMLSNMALLYLGADVLILQDTEYNVRFWTRFEAWLSMAMASPEGLKRAPERETRCSIKRIHGTGLHIEEELKNEYATGTAPEALEILQGEKIKITNQGDKGVQLAKATEIDALSRRCAKGLLNEL
ncbi:unnamed protein product [Prorocentrum cordatum]|uniref:Uncharacterized protein n=1 Tax=Prorocentrum cordatum TaxID=2364126 RepID=A0ABN9V8N2_9DINO|nr:unnamed protein product [Polarella glacialis]